MIADCECKTYVKIDNDDLSNNLNNEKNSFTDMKRKDSGILSELLKSFPKDTDETNDSGNDSDESETNYSSLINAMSSCDIANKNKNTNNIKNDKEKAANTNKKCTENVKMSNVAKKDADAPDTKKSEKKNSDTIKLHISIKRNVLRTKTRKNCENDGQNSKDDMDKLGDKLSSIGISNSENLSKQHKANSSCQKSKANRKNDNSKKSVDSNDSDKTKLKEKVILVERGPIRSHINDAKIKTLPYEGTQVHRNSLSGGKVLTNEPVHIIEDVIPVTVNNNLNIDLTSIVRNFNETEIQMVMECIEKVESSAKIASLDSEDVSNYKIQEIKNDLVKQTSIYNEMRNNQLVDQVYIEQPNDNINNYIINPATPLLICNSPYQDGMYLTHDSGISGSDSNLSQYSYSPNQGFISPSYENSKNSFPSVSGGSFSSSSSTGSPNFPPQDETFTFIDVHNNYSYGDVGLIDNNLSPLSNVGSEYLNNLYSPYSTGEGYTLDNDNCINGDAHVPSLKISNAPCFPNHTFNDKSPSQKSDSSFVKALKSIKKTFLPVASKASPCCVDYKRSAKQMLKEMFERLDISMQKKIYNAVHAVNEDKLMELFDGQLSSWNNLESQFPRLALLYMTCQRLLMRTETMVKLFEVYRNGHTVLDRAVLTCSQSPLVARYLAECMTEAIPHLPQTREFLIDKNDSSGCTILHRAASRGTQCATALACLLSINDQSHLPIFDIEKCNVEGYTPLHIACSEHNFEGPGSPCSCHVNVHVLLKHGRADPNKKDRKSGNTALHIAVDTSTCAPDLIMLLLQHGADPAIRNYNKSTPLDLARTASLSNSKSQHSKRVIDILKKFK